MSTRCARGSPRTRRARRVARRDPRPRPTAFPGSSATCSTSPSSTRTGSRSSRRRSISADCSSRPTRDSSRRRAAAGSTTSATFDAAPVIITDGDRVLQIVSNLLENAFEWTPDGGRVALGPRRRRTARVSVSVADTGPGHPAGRARAHLPAVLVDERAGDRPRPRDRRELAAGARRPARALESSVGRGSRFELVLPARARQRRAPSVERGLAPVARSSRALERGTGRSAAGARLERALEPVERPLEPVEAPLDARASRTTTRSTSEREVLDPRPALGARSVWRRSSRRIVWPRARAPRRGGARPGHLGAERPRGARSRRARGGSPRARPRSARTTRAARAHARAPRRASPSRPSLRERREPRSGPLDRVGVHGRDCSVRAG